MNWIFRIPDLSINDKEATTEVTLGDTFLKAMKMKFKEWSIRPISEISIVTASKEEVRGP